MHCMIFIFPQDPPQETSVKEIMVIKKVTMTRLQSRVIPSVMIRFILVNRERFAKENGICKYPWEDI